MLEAAEMEPGMTVLDLCCGPTGRLTAEALDMGASSVTAVDSSNSVLNLSTDPRIDIHCTNIYTFFGLVRNSGVHFEWDIIACQQAVNYWWNKVACPARRIDRILKPGGAFVFNTFNTLPPTMPAYKVYEVEDVDRNACRASELYYMVDGIVYHVQAREGCKPHMTSFDWISPESFERSLKAQFNSFLRIRNGGTDIYVCRKV